MMRMLSEDFFSNSPLLAYPVFAMVLFLIVFVAASARALLTRPSAFKSLANLPLEDDTTRPATRNEGGTA